MVETAFAETVTLRSRSSASSASMAVMIFVVEAMGSRALAFCEKRYSPVFASIMKAAVDVIVGGFGSPDGERRGDHAAGDVG